MNRRLAGLRSWDADWSGLRVVVTGIGVSGFSAADTLVELGAVVVVVDGADTEKTRAAAETLRIVGASQVLLGPSAVASLPDVDGVAPDLVVTSPGWNPSQPVLAAAARAGIAIWGDVELAWRLRNRPGAVAPEWLAVTGTNGKTTTVEMTASMLRAAGLRAIAAGNVGTPILDAIRDPQGYDVLAVELSSFQLHWTHSISPLASVCLNVAEDHVDWHGGYANYLADKAKVYSNTRVACVYNVDQRETETMVAEADVVDGCRAIGFTIGTPAIGMVGVVEDLLVDRAFIDERRTTAAELAAVADTGTPPAPHTVANALASAALVRAYGVQPEGVRDGLRSFSPGDHRIQPVARIDGTVWVNDSKATNPHAAAASLAAFESVVWIAGGLSKGVHYDELVTHYADRLKAVVLIGVDTADLRDSLARHAPKVPVIDPASGHTGDMQPTAHNSGAEKTAGQTTVGQRSSGQRVMDDAVAAAAAVAAPSDVVLMAPAAASMDQFSSYAGRGEAFIESVHALARTRQQGEESP